MTRRLRSLSLVAALAVAPIFAGASAAHAAGVAPGPSPVVAAPTPTVADGTAPCIASSWVGVQYCAAEHPEQFAVVLVQLVTEVLQNHGLA